MVKVVDLRSDTVTLPTQAMRDAMYKAELGDDVFGEDPTVNRLESMAAERLGMEAAVLVSSGTQGNLLAILSHTNRGDEIICGDLSHILLYEVAGAAALGSVQVRAVPTTKGMLDLDAVRATIRGENIHYPKTGLIAVENTHNRQGGTVVTVDQMQQIADLAHGFAVPFHVDGARIFNAAVALDVPVQKLVGMADSVTFCLSKGLSAPIGSILCGSHAFIMRARKYRKMVGSGMRQAGIIAAAGIVALEEMVNRLAEDHVNARTLAEGLAEIPGIYVDLSTVQTNLVIFDLPRSPSASTDFSAGLAELGVRCSIVSENRMRMVTHYGITAADIAQALSVARQVLRVPVMR